MRRSLLLALTLVGCAPTVAEQRQADQRQARTEARLQKALKGLTPGRPQSCLDGTDRRFARVESYGGAVLFRVGATRVYRNDMGGNCAPSGVDPIFVTATPTTSICRGDIAQLVDRVSGFPVGSCAYGDFTPYSRAK